SIHGNPASGPRAPRLQAPRAASLRATIDTVPSGSAPTLTPWRPSSAHPPGRPALEASLGTPEGRECAAGHVARVVEPEGRHAAERRGGRDVSLRKDSGLIDAPGSRLVGTKGNWPV